MSDAEQKPEVTPPQSSEIMQMMDSYHSSPLRDALQAGPWILISVILHVGFVILAMYITWEVKLPKEEVVITPKMEEKFVPQPPVMVAPKPKETRQDINKTERQQDTPDISQPDLPNLDNLFKKQDVVQGPTILAAPGDNPMMIGEIGGSGLRFSGGAGSAAGDLGGWGGWEKGRILTVWLFDESVSMKDDQQEIRDRVDDVYKKLELAAGLRGSSMKIVTAVASYGKDTHFLIEKPTEDVEEVRKAIDRVKVDETGEENFLKAINTVIDAFSGYAKEYRRRIVIILVTDEGGDDDDGKTGPDSLLEQTVAHCKATDTSILVFGRLGGFYKAGTSERLGEKGEVVTVNRGRDTGLYEMLPPGGGLFTHWAFVYGGFGPYSYARLTRETGGMMFLLNTMTSTYDYEKMLADYQPEVVSRQEIVARDRKSPLRAAIRQCVMEWSELDSKYPIPVWSILPSRLAEMTAQGEKGCKAVVEFCNAWIPRLEAMSNVSIPENSGRWRADREFLLAQLYKRRFLAEGYLIAIQKIRENRDIPPAGENGWSVTRSSTRPPAGSEREKQLNEVLEKFQQVVDHHPGTPWAEYARVEIRYLGEVKVSPHGMGGKNPKIG